MSNNIHPSDNQLKWWARLERDVIQYLSDTKRPITPQRDCREHVHMTLADAAELNSKGEPLCLIEIKGRRLYGGDHVIGNLLNMFHEDSADVQGQWQRLVNSRLPYMIVVGFHRVNRGESIEQAYRSIDDSPIHDWVVIIGHGQACAMNRYNTLSEFRLTGISYAESIIDTLKRCRQFKFDDLIKVSRLPSRDLYGAKADARVAEITNLPDNEQQSRCITEVEGITEYIATLAAQGKASTSILQHLIAKGITHVNRALITTDISNRLPPKKTRGETYDKFEQVLIECFRRAYKRAPKLKAQTTDLRSVSSFSESDAYEIQQAAERGELPSSLNLARTTLGKWFVYHPQRSFLISCKSQARYQFIHGLSSTPVRREEAEQGEQGELWAYGEAKLCKENRQRIERLEEMVQTQLELIERLYERQSK